MAKTIANSSVGSGIPHIIEKYKASVAPKAAPLEVPSVVALASGLFKRICIICPLTAREEPIIIATRILGNLISKKIAFLISESRLFVLTCPLNKAPIEIKTNNRIKKRTILVCFFIVFTPL